MKMRILVAALIAAIPMMVSAQTPPTTAKSDKPAKKVMASTTNVAPAAPVAVEETAAPATSATPGVATASLEKVNEAASTVDNAQATAEQATDQAANKAADKAKKSVKKGLDKLFGK